MLPAPHELPELAQDDQGEAAELPAGPAGARSSGGSPAECVVPGDRRSGQTGWCPEHCREQRDLGETAVTYTGTCRC